MPSSSRRVSRGATFGRGLRGRCPNCGGGKLFTGMADLKPACPKCGLRFEREDGYWVGAMTVLMAVVLIVFGVFFIGGMLLFWPDVPWTALVWGGVGLNILVPFVLYGWSKTVWLGLDMAFSPPRDEEFPIAD